jgi:hypothetical protein
VSCFVSKANSPRSPWRTHFRFLPTLVSLSVIYSELLDSGPLLHFVFLRRASSYVKAIDHAQLIYSQVGQIYLRPSVFVSILFRLITPCQLQEWTLRSTSHPSTTADGLSVIHDDPENGHRVLFGIEGESKSE